MKQVWRLIRNIRYIHVILVLTLVLLMDHLAVRLGDNYSKDKPVDRRIQNTDVIADDGNDDKTMTIEKYDFFNSPIGKDFRVTEVNCDKIFRGDKSEIAKAVAIDARNLSEPRSDFSIYMEIKAGCRRYKLDRGFISDALTDEEDDFPIAVNVMLYKELHQVEDLLRLIYRPQNYYCLHVDKTSDARLHAGVRALADCFHNVLVSRDVVDVVYGQLNLMTPELICIYELLKYKKWKYFINLTGQEFPIKTNKQMVRIFRAFNGGNDIVTSPGKSQSRAFRNRWNKRGTPPHGIHMVKGSSHVVLSRQFAEFITSDRRVNDLISFLFGTIFPEESFWTTVNNDPGLMAPGGFSGTTEEAIAKPWNGRVKWWMGNPDVNCTGKYRRAICIFGVGDIHRIVRETPIIANKFYWDFQPMALKCMQEWLFNRTRDEYLGLYQFDPSPYSQLPNAKKVYKRTVL